MDALDKEVSDIVLILFCSLPQTCDTKLVKHIIRDTILYSDLKTTGKMILESFYIMSYFSMLHM